MSFLRPARRDASSPVRIRGGRASFGFIFASAVASAFSIGVMFPILPNLLKQLTGGDAADAAEWNVIFATAGGAMSFLSGPILGLLSDRFGRRPVLLISLAGLGADFAFMALAPSLGWLLVGRLIGGATAGLFTTANAYVADVTPPDRRARAFGWLGSAFSFGFLAGPALGGLLGQIHLRLPFAVAAVLTLINAVYGALVMPESLPPERRRARLDPRAVNPVAALAILGGRPGLAPLALSYFLNQLANMVWPTVFVLYGGYRYHWTPGTVGVLMMITGSLGIAVQSFLVSPVIRRMGESGALRAGAAASTLAFLWYGLAPTGFIYALGFPLGSLGGLMIPGLQGLMTREVDPTEQGRLQGLNQSLSGLSSVLGPVIFGTSFAFAVRRGSAALTGLPMIEAAICMALGTAATLLTRKPSRAAGHAPAA